MEYLFDLWIHEYFLDKPPHTFPLVENEILHNMNLRSDDYYYSNKLKYESLRESDLAAEQSKIYTRFINVW